MCNKEKALAYETEGTDSSLTVCRRGHSGNRREVDIFPELKLPSVCSPVTGLHGFVLVRGVY